MNSKQQRRETVLREIGAIEGLGRIAETMRLHLEDSIPSLIDCGVVPESDPLRHARSLQRALDEVLSQLIAEDESGEQS
jgi:hypothetical protein